MIKYIVLFTILSPFFGMIGCSPSVQTVPADYVDPFIGTAYTGHTYPAATTPFGMVQVGPDNGVSGWEFCSGYHDASKTIMGFSHTHLSGTGAADMGDIMIMPVVGDIPFSPGEEENPSADNSLRFRMIQNRQVRAITGLNLTITTFVQK